MELPAGVSLPVSASMRKTTQFTLCPYLTNVDATGTARGSQHAWGGPEWEGAINWPRYIWVSRNLLRTFGEFECHVVLENGRRASGVIGRAAGMGDYMVICVLGWSKLVAIEETRRGP
jgi:hypothetical protein